MPYLGVIDPTLTAIVGGWIRGATLSWWDEQKVKDLVPQFPEVFKKAQTDWKKFLIGVESGLFSENEKKEVVDWFAEFPQMWETIRPNFLKDKEGRQFGDRVDDFIGTILRSSVYKNRSLGIAPVVVAGVLIVGGIAASLWGVSYIQKQNNISNMIDGVIAGKIPPETLRKAIEENSNGGMFGGVQDLLQWVVIGAAAWFLLPIVLKKK